MNNSISEILKKLRNNEKVTETELLQKMASGDTIFEYAIKRGRNIDCDRFSKTKSLDIILDKERYELLKNVDLKTLLKLNRKDLNKKYIETILELFKSGKNINISFISPFDKGESLEDVADFYLIYYSYDLVDYLPFLDEDYLLATDLENKKSNKIIDFLFAQEKKTFLEVLLSKTDEKTIKELLRGSLKRIFNVAMLLRRANITQEKVDYELKSNAFIDGVVDKMNRLHDSIVLSDYEELLLRKLYSLFIVGSDKKAVQALINSYRIQLQKKNPNTLIEIEELIKLKREGKPAYIKIGDSSYSLDTNGIEVNKPITDTVNHEMGHALFHNLTDGSVPLEFWSIIERVRSKASTLRKLSEYSKNENQEILKVRKIAINYYNDTFPLMNKVIEVYKIRNSLKRIYDYESDQKRIRYERETLKIRKEISDYLEKSKEEKKQEYLKKGYSEEDLNILFQNTFSVKEYARMHKRIQCRELEEVLKSSILGASRSIGDILDAIYQGNFLAGKLYYEGKPVDPVTGHGLFYYNYDPSRVFDEILADYRTIMMSQDSDKYLSDLRYYVGDELVDFLDNYYNNIMTTGYIKEVEYGLNGGKKL